jgi:6-phosphogluconolactonase/glucosamine-6-phosphate isomerase/deaminase
MTVFLSYHSSKHGVVEHLAGYLQRAGISSWFAPRDISPGAAWDTAIADAIKASRALVLLFCTAADASAHVKRELHLADRYGVPVYWVRLERVEPERLGYFLSSTQWIDWLDNRDATLESLVSDLQRLESAQSPGPLSSGSSPDPRLPPSPLGWPSGILVFETERQAAEATARVYFGIGYKYPDSTLILPTGRSATQIFRAMNRLAEERDEPPFGEAHLITDTETFGVWRGHHSSRTKHVEDTLISPLRRRGMAPPDDQLHLLSGIFMDEDPIQAARLVLRTWPPSLHAVSLSPAGEVLAYETGVYNQPEEIVEDGPRVVEVSDHGKRYIDPDQPSRSILTIGLGTALSAEVLLALAFDHQKAGILRRLLTGTPTPGVPATLLQMHLNTYIMTTRTVAQSAGLTDHQMTLLSPEDAANWILGQS